MKILYLGPERRHVTDFLAASGDEVARCERAVSAGDLLLDGVDFLVSYGYRHLLSPEVLARFPGRAINLHISLLPWNRGADPNLWSFLEDSPKGVTIHLIDEGIDTGDILAQREVVPLASDTLRTSYQRLEFEIERLLVESWPAIRAGELAPRRQPPGGSSHRMRDRDTVATLLTEGWETPVALLTGRRRLPA